jgi:DNA helicase IV
VNLPKPRGRQSDVIFLPGTGHQVVLGTAGTGKTTMAILRADHLAAPTTPNHGPVLVVTYNNTLVTYLRHVQGWGSAT